MTPQELKNSILQRAIEGKLVEQRAEEGSGDQLISNSSINKRKNTESLFDIPESWEWINLAELCNLIGGYAFKSSQYLSDGVRVIRISDFNENGLIDTDKKFYREEELLKKYLIKSNDILMCMTGGTVGKTVFLGEINEKLYLNQRVAAIRVENKTIIDINYLYYVISSNFIKTIINTQKNSTNDNISMKLIQEFPIPLPPLNEQKRIVEKIEELMPLVEAYEENWKRLEGLNKKFPEDMKKSLLQEAIKGKLVEQRVEEGTGEELYETIQAEKKKLIKEEKIKKQKALPEITEEEMPFEIPESWKWVRLGDVSTIARGGSPRPIKDYITQDDDGINWIKIGDTEKNSKYINSTIEKIKPEGLKKSRLVKPGDFLLTNSMSFGRPYILNIEGCIHDGWLVISQDSLIYNKDFLYWMLSSGYAFNQFARRVSGAVVKNLNSDKVSESIFPLPPLNEQKRIVERLEELLPLCDQLMTRETERILNL